MSFKRILVRARMTGKPVPDFVIVKDYGVARGLALFFPLDASSPGCIACYDTVEPRTDSNPWAVGDPMTFSEVSLDYFYKGRAPKKGDARPDELFHRYERAMRTNAVRVYKDRAEYRAYREAK